MTGMNMVDYTVEEQVICYLARSFDPDEEIGVFALNNCTNASLSLAKKLYAPRLAILKQSDGRYCVISELCLSPVVGQVPEKIIETRYSSEEAFAMVNNGRYMVIMQPVQIDKNGFINLSLVGDFAKPKMTFVGSRGAPSNTVNQRKTLYFVTNHSSRTFVEQVDFKSGVGYSQERSDGTIKWGTPIEVISNLCVIDFDEACGAARLKSLHKGVTRRDVEENTGFELIVPENVPETPAPKRDELDLIRTEIDPLGMRRLDFATKENYAQIETEIRSAADGA